jgi:uncharacterized protein (DUF849 family)
VAAFQSKVIVTCAVTGAIHTPSMSPHLPITPDEIAREAIAAAEAGASIVHLHARKPENGQPSQDPELFRAFLPAIAERSDAVINLTTGGAPNMLVEERLLRKSSSVRNTPCHRAAGPACPSIWTVQPRIADLPSLLRIG